MNMTSIINTQLLIIIIFDLITTTKQNTAKTRATHTGYVWNARSDACRETTQNTLTRLNRATLVPILWHLVVWFLFFF